jgi:hypothetical protein
MEQIAPARAMPQYRRRMAKMPPMIATIARTKKGIRKSQIKPGNIIILPGPKFP